ncbi:ABC transporter ATP-binding protein [Candidatus Nanohalobium constans]|uniref:ABC-2 type transport system ATP-binding protein n=1 Tax=Candidatus Nanohalobium constans TaxID=2565781 RepID=A0A5Q0UGB0_9ARCH|nr:ABC transporter ATP-binding protein [Candidatus Nanohalobium constans]QGA80647.1 ABC-2 type transport system ATP-binding protein [Candidatus Nanohalobium constans]
MSKIELQGVEKSYGSHEVLKGFDLSVKEGEIFGLLGPNGVGKTTLFQTVIGLLREDDGTVKIEGEEHTGGKEVRSKIGYLPSDISFYGGMSARENLEYFAQLAGTEPDFDELLELVGLEEDADRNPKDFSTGMKKRLGIAQSLIKDPEIIIYDEPTTGLDPEGKRRFRQHAEKINKEKDKTIIISSHITTEISPLCDRFGIMKDGEIVACGTKAELSKETDNDLGILIEAEDTDKLVQVVEDSSLDVEVLVDDTEVEVVTEDDIRSELFRILLENDVDVKTFEIEEETLENAYMKLTGEA